MVAEIRSRHFAALLFLLLSQTWCTGAQPTNAAATTTDASEGGFLSSGPTSAAGENAAGASGAEGGSVNLSMGAIVAIVVVVVVVVMLGAGTAVLFFIAKKRQWKVRQSIRRTATRVTSMVLRPKTPRTPRSKPMTLPSVSEVSEVSSTERASSSPPRKDNKAPLKIDTSTRSLSRSPTPVISNLPPALAAKKQQKTQSQQMLSRSSERKLDLEKRPQTAATSAFDMDSPETGSIWTRMFGRK